MTIPQWLDWARRLRAIAQTGLSYDPPEFDADRYRQVQEIATEITSANSQLEPSEVETLFTHDEGHITPKIDVRGVVFREGKMLLVQERVDERWTLPGGWADVGDSPSSAIEREIWEEAGYQTKATKLLALYDRNRHAHPPSVFQAYKIFFLCEIIGGEGTILHPHEILATGFFAEDDLPALSTPRVTEAQLKHFFEHHRNPALPTDFD